MLIGETWKDSGQVENSLSFDYDEASNLISASDDHSSYTFTVDLLGRATQVAADNPAAPAVVLDQAFNALGARTSLAASYDDGFGFIDDFENNYTRDNLQRITSLEQTSQPGGNAVADKRVDFGYNAAGQFTDIDRYDDLADTSLVASTDYLYDGRSRNPIAIGRLDFAVQKFFGSTKSVTSARAIV